MSKRYYPLAIMLCLVMHMHLGAEGFATLQEAVMFAKTHDEHPVSDYERHFNPVFTSFHKEQVPTFLGGLFRRALEYFGFAKPPVWTVDMFKETLVRVTDARVKRGYDGYVGIKFTPKPGAQLFIWGDIQGAFHSFVRTLQQVNELGVIGDDLKVIKPDHYLVFNGDLISRSAYNMETLTLALRVLEANPEKVFYIRGNHELENYWYGYGLKTELRIKASHLSEERVPLETEVNAFFDTLPIALFLGMVPESRTNFMRIAHLQSAEFEKIDTAYIADSLYKAAKDSQKPEIFSLEENIAAEKEVKLQAVISGLPRQFSREKVAGLRLMPPVEGVPAWTILSCPTTIYQRVFDFYADTFVKVTAASVPEKWTLTHYARDPREGDDFKTQEYNLLMGKE